jgi:hypothetical protein
MVEDAMVKSNSDCDVMFSRYADVENLQLVLVIVSVELPPPMEMTSLLIPIA